MSSLKEAKKTKAKKKNILSLIFLTGLILFTAGFVLLVATFIPVVKEEGKYMLIDQKKVLNTVIKPVNDDFDIIIPKIGANSAVIDNVSPYDSKQYQVALTHGVAHAKGTAYPGEVGNDFIFAHSSVDWFIANRYNSVFYLIHKLEKGDEIDIYFKKQKFVYKVLEKDIVDPTDVSFLSPITKDGSSILTLMTCWPPGTTLKRLIIRAKNI